MRVRIDFASKRARVTVDGKDLGMFRDSVEVDGTSISLEEWEYSSNKRVGEHKSEVKAPEPTPLPASVRQGAGASSSGGAGVRMDVGRGGAGGGGSTSNVRTPKATEEKTFVVTKGEEDKDAG